MIDALRLHKNVFKGIKGKYSLLRINGNLKKVEKIMDQIKKYEEKIRNLRAKRNKILKNLEKMVDKNRALAKIYINDPEVLNDFVEE